MSSQTLHFDESLADSEVRSYKKNDDNLAIELVLWNEKTTTLDFRDVIGILDLGVFDISALVIEEGEDEFMLSVLKRLFENIPDDHSYKLYAIYDNDDEVSFKVVAKSVDM